MEVLVPMQKMGVFADLAGKIIRDNPDIPLEQLRSKFADAWDTTDQRLGQFVYDNWFMSKGAKDMAFIAVRSVGWNLGTIQQIGGGLVDAGRMAGRAGQKIAGKDNVNPIELTHKMAYCVALPMIAMTYGALYQYGMTGQWPSELKDYFFPKDGGTDRYGMPTRQSLPTYIKDLYHYWHAPGQTVLNKLNPLWSLVSQLYQNKDFYGVEIHDKHDPWFKKGEGILGRIGMAEGSQTREYLNFAAKTALPFAVRNYQQNEQSGKTLAGKIQPFIGITPAPGDINRTKAEMEMNEIFKNKKQAGAISLEDAAKRELKNKLANEIHTNNGTITQEIRDAAKTGGITSQQLKNLQNSKGYSPLQNGMEHLKTDEAMQIWDVATDEEKEAIRPLILKKIQNSKTMSSNEKSIAKKRITG